MEVGHEEVKEEEQRIILFSTKSLVCSMQPRLAITYKVWAEIKKNKIK